MAGANIIQERDMVTLVLDENRFRVDKEKLILKSKYFRSLFAHNFSDSKNNEQHVKYDIESSVLQDFCNYIEESSSSQQEESIIKLALQKFILNITVENYSGLKQLLKLSTIYQVESLINDLCDLLIGHWMKPQFSLDIWKMSKDICLNTLKDVSFSACLNNFIKLPLQELLNISENDFLQLLFSINVKSSKDYLAYVAKERLKREESISKNADLKIKIEIQKFLDALIDLDIRPSMFYCLYAETEFCCDCSRLMIYSIRKQCPVNLQEFIEIGKMNDGIMINYMDNNRTDRPTVNGMSVIGRDFSIYRIGGEIGIGSGNFVMDVWRYCLISKKWYYLARMRKPRRHMAVAIVDDNLILIGGVGRYRLKLSCIEVLDLNTGKWIESSPEPVPEQFTDVPPTCVMDGIIVMCISNIYMYNPTTSSWLKVRHDLEAQEFLHVTCLACYGHTLFIGKEDGRYSSHLVSWKVSDDENGQTVIHEVRINRTTDYDFHCVSWKLYIDEDGEAVGIGLDNYHKPTAIERGLINQDSGIFESKIDAFQLPNNAHSLNMIPLNIFSVNEPSTLYKQVSFDFDSQILSV